MTYTNDELKQQIATMEQFGAGANDYYSTSGATLMDAYTELLRLRELLDTIKKVTAKHILNDGDDANATDDVIQLIREYEAANKQESEKG